MNTLDKHYISLQFSNKIFKKNGTEFQTFFENIMEKAFVDFQKIKPYGNKGDGGNDGYRKDLGIYYQVYAPNEPKINELKASKKLKRDFEKLYTSGWDEISNIKEYNFVFNDKYSGSIQELEKVISELKTANPNIEFKLFLAKNLEEAFFELKESDILSLGFNIDSRQAISNAFDYLENVKIELDKENAEYAQRILENIKEIISKLSDENLSLEYEILECRCLQKMEKTGEAKKYYESLIKRFPKDPRAFLYLAEIYLNDKDFDKNKELLEKAKEIDSGHWLLRLEELVRKNHLGKKIDMANIKEKTFPDDSRIRANFYRLYALFLEDAGDKINADSFIEKAIHLNPNRFSNFIVKLILVEKKLFSDQKVSEKPKQAKELLKEIKKVEDRFFGYGNIGARNNAILNIKKLNALRILENFSELQKISKETLELSMSCYFDKQIEQIISASLQFAPLTDDNLTKLLKYIENSKKEISDELSNHLIFQFNIRETLFSNGKKFFIEINNQKYITFINNLENKKYKEILNFLKNDNQFSIVIAHTSNDIILKQRITDSLLKKEAISEIELISLFDDERIFEVLQKNGINELNLNYFGLQKILSVAQQKNAWDFEIIILQKLIEKEKDAKQKFNLQLQLFNAHFNLKQYPEVIDIGKQLLEIDFAKKYLDIINKEALLVNTIIACFERGKVDDKSYAEAKKILKKYQLSEPSFEFKVGIEAEVYLYNNSPQKALDTVIEGVKIKRTFSSQEYAKLFFLLSTKIGNQIDLKLTSLDEIEEGIFVKLKSKDTWYFIGEKDELDAIKISKKSDKYSLFEGKKLGDKIVFENDYSSEKKEDSIEFIFPIEKYVLWQVVQNFQKLSVDGDLEGVCMVEVPQKGDSLDLKNILKMMEDMHKKTEPFFEMYCKNNVSLAILTVSEGGLTNAIGRIQNEQKGFINFSTGTIEDFETQKKVARTIIQKKIPFYIDGTSALFLSQIGYLDKIYEYIPTLKVPQSVISLLGDINDKFTYTPEQAGHMGYAQGKINYLPVDKKEGELIKNNISKSVKLLESNPDSIMVISSANKADCFMEKEIPSELSDACILAQKEKLPVLTEDFIYLKMNELQTKKEAPKYFSSLALLRVLYEDKKIGFDEYIEYFGYLSSYRFRFLSLNSNDIEMAVFGSGDIKTIKPENIRKLNFPLTLSEEYGVSFQKAFTIVGGFLFKVLMDNTVTADIAEKIFIEILESFPTEKNKKDLGQMLLRICLRTIENNKSKFVLFPNAQIINEKFSKLLHATEIYNSETQLWTPNK